MRGQLDMQMKSQMHCVNFCFTADVWVYFIQKVDLSNPTLFVLFALMVFVRDVRRGRNRLLAYLLKQNTTAFRFHHHQKPQRIHLKKWTLH